MRLCAFDLDGTLIDSIKDIAMAMNRALLSCGYAAYEIDEYYHMVGNGMRILCTRAVQNNPVKDGSGIEEVEKRYQHCYLQNCSKYTKIYPGIISCLLKLKADGFMLGVISNKPQAQVQKVISALFPKHLFSFVQGQQDGVRKKPFPDSLLNWMEMFAIEKEDVIFIGDSAVDIDFGKNAEVDTIGVLWGFRNREELEGAGAGSVVENPEELYGIIRKKYDGNF